MTARIQQALTQLLTLLQAMPLGRRLALLGTAVGLVGLVLGAAWWAQRPFYRPLYHNLSDSDAAAIVQALRAEKVAYELEDGGHTVLVPASELYDVRLTLATQGLPEGGGVGFEIFDRQTLGQTDFLQRLNYQRALQGELARTISQLGGVESTRVHLAIPERALFLSQDRRPSASVVVKLVAGRTLSRTQIDGIVHLVASSVEGLATDAVTVVDATGRILTSEGGGLDATGASSGALEYQQTVERTLEERVQSMLAAVVGRDKVVARVTARIDFARVERTEETYDPDATAIRTQQTTREETTGGASAGGAPGVQANLTNEAATEPAAEGPKTERREETQSYEVSKVVSRTVGAPGVVQQLSVAVLVDGTYEEAADGTRTFSARPQEELDRLTELVKSAVGFSEERGDKLDVASVAFQTEELPAGPGVLSAVGVWALWSLRFLVPLVVLLVGLLFVVRPVLQTFVARSGRLTGPVAAGALTQENLALTQQNPERAAQLVREWLAENAPGGEPG